MTFETIGQPPVSARSSGKRRASFKRVVGIVSVVGIKIAHHFLGARRILPLALLFLTNVLLLREAEIEARHVGGCSSTRRAFDTVVHRSVSERSQVDGRCATWSSDAVARSARRVELSVFPDRESVRAAPLGLVEHE